MSLNEASYCAVQHQEMIIKTETKAEDDEFIEDSLLISSKLTRENRGDNASCDQFFDTFSPCPIKNEPVDSLADVLQQEAESLEFKEEIVIEEHEPGWTLTGEPNNAGISIDGLNQCDSFQKNALRTFESESQCEKMYNCAHCRYKTNRRVQFMKHYKCQHSKEGKVFKCQECSYETKYKSNLKQHKKSKHAKEVEVYKCQECSFEARWKGDLSRHYKYKHSEDAEVHKCGECSYETGRKDYLLRHYKRKHPKVVQMYKCQKCPFETKMKGHLTRHYKTKHLKDQTRLEGATKAEDLQLLP